MPGDTGRQAALIAAASAPEFCTSAEDSGSSREQLLEASDHRDSRLRLTVAASAANKFIGFAVSVVAVPITVTYLGVERYGIWLTISSVLSWMALFDLGLASGLRNALSESYAKGDREAARRNVSSAAWLLLLLAVLLALLAALSIALVPWPRIFNLQPASPLWSETTWTVAVVFGILVLRFPLSIVSVVYYGFQEGYRAAFWDSAAVLANLAGIWAISYTQRGLFGLALASLGASLAITLANAVFLFGREKPWLRPALAALSWPVVKKQLDIGYKFLAIQMAAIIVYQTDLVIISRILGPSNVPTYALTGRLFTYVIGLQALLLNALTPAYTEAMVRKDLAWVQKNLVRSVLASLAAGALLGAAFFFWGGSIIDFWAGSRGVVPSQELLLVFSLWLVSYLVQNCFATFLIAIGSISLMSVLSVPGAVINIVLCIFFGMKWGVVGVAFGNLVTLFIGLVQSPLETRYRLRQAGGSSIGIG